MNLSFKNRWSNANSNEFPTKIPVARMSIAGTGIDYSRPSNPCPTQIQRKICVAIIIIPMAWHRMMLRVEKLTSELHYHESLVRSRRFQVCACQKQIVVLRKVIWLPQSKDGCIKKLQGLCLIFVYPRKEGPFKLPLKKHEKVKFSYFIPSPSL
jgi:hypothetical protein